MSYEQRIAAIEKKVLHAAMETEFDLQQAQDNQREIDRLERKVQRGQMWWHLSAGFVAGVSVMTILNLTIQLLLAH